MGSGPDPIAHAYAVFARPAPASLAVCTACCMEPDTERRMLATPLAALSDSDVGAWLDAAFGGAGAAEALRWILPRVLDLLAQGTVPGTMGVALALARLPQAGFPQGWTQAEVTAVTEACLHLLDRHVASGQGGLDDLLCLVSRAGLGVGPFLARLDALPDDVLADLLDRERPTWGPREVRQSAFWDNTAERDRVLAWLTSWAMLDRMHGAGLKGNARAARVADALDAMPRSDWPD